MYTALLLALASPLPPTTEFNGWAMTMPYRITVGAPLASPQRQEVEILIRDTFDEVDRTLNNWNPDSEISRVNAAPADTPIPLSQPLYDLLHLCDQIVALSGGRFDPTVGPLVALWRTKLADKQAPTAAERLELAHSIGWHHIHLYEGELVKDNAHTALDLCAISKGYTLDLLTDRLHQKGYDNTLVEWAGELRASGHHPEGRDWMVALDPGLQIKGQPLAPIALHNNAIATSGDYAHDGWNLPEHRYCHIVDPHTAMPLEVTPHSIATVTAIAPTCALADALATAGMVFPNRLEAEQWAQEVVELYPTTSFLILSYDHSALRPGERPPVLQP